MEQRRNEGTYQSNNNPTIPRVAESIVGYKVKIKSLFGEEIVGEIFSYDSQSGCITLQETANPHKRTYRIFNISFIEKLDVLEFPSSPVDLTITTPTNYAKIEAKEKAAIELAEKEKSKIGVGVTAEAQHIFNSLTKMDLACKWEGTTIIVADIIRIDSPYTVESCNGRNDSSLAWVKRILEREKQKIRKQQQQLLQQQQQQQQQKQQAPQQQPPVQQKPPQQQQKAPIHPQSHHPSHHVPHQPQHQSQHQYQPHHHHQSQHQSQHQYYNKNNNKF